ncbi:MAG: hypothetical protein Q9168_004207 [Polycauliona sp. 1 TL-2023]
MSAILVLQHLISPDLICLGRLVTDLNDPTQNFYDDESATSLNPPQDFSVITGKSYKEVTAKAFHSRLDSLLVSLASASVSAATNKSTSLTTKRASTYKLHNPDDKFKSIVGKESGRRWMEKALKKGRDVYRFGVKAFATADHGSRNRVEQIAETEQVFAVHYRKLHFILFSSKRLDKGALQGKKTCWKVFWSVRSDADDDHVVEATVQEAVLPPEYIRHFDEQTLDTLYFKV